MTIHTTAAPSQENTAATKAAPPAIHIVLVHPQIPHNTGAIGRLCVGMQARLHLIEPCGFSLSEKAVRRSGLDYWQFLDLHTHPSWDAFLETCQPTSMVFLSTRGTRNLYDVSFRAACWLVFGNETHGLPDPLYSRYAQDLIRIPQPGPHARSINLANAVAITAYEAYRQISAASASASS